MALAEISALVDTWSAAQAREDMRAGVVATVIAEVNRDREKRPWPFHPADFFCSLEHLRPDPPGGDEISRKLDSLAGLGAAS